MSNEITILCSQNVTADIMNYIADCWIEFVVGELDLKPSDLVMVLPS